MATLYLVREKERVLTVGFVHAFVSQDRVLLVLFVHVHASNMITAKIPTHRYKHINMPVNAYSRRRPIHWFRGAITRKVHQQARATAPPSCHVKSDRETSLSAR